MVVDIRKPGMDSLVYLIFMKEKTQKKAVELIYDKPYSEINIRRFKNSRERLMKDGYLTSDGSIRNAKFKSNIGPIIEEINERADQEQTELTEKELEGLKIMLESEWFADLFNEDIFESLPDVGRPEGIIKVGAFGGAIEVISEIIDHITYAGRLFNSDKNYENVSEHQTFRDYIGESSWKTDQTPEKVYKVAEEELSKHIQQDVVEWKLYLWRKITIEDECLFDLPKLSFGLTYLPSEMNVIQREAFGVS